MKKIIITSAISIALVLSACGEHVSVDNRLTAAKSYLNENKINESIIELKNAIRADDKNGEARYLLGQIYLDLGSATAAVKELKRAKELEYDISKWLPLLARAYVLTESDNEVLLLSEEAQQLTSVERSQYLAYKTYAELHLGELARAKDTATLAQSSDDNNKYNMLASAYISVAEKRLDDAKVTVQHILHLDADLADAVMLQGQLYIAFKDYAKASQSYKHYLSLQPRSNIVYFYLAEALLKNKEFDEAEKYADAILAKSKEQPFAHYIKAMAGFYRNDYYKASEHAEFAMANNFNQYALRLVAGASAFYLKNWELSYKHFSAVEDYLPKDHLGRRMLAVTQLELGLVAEISGTVNEFEGGLGDAELVSSLTYKLFELGAMDEANKLLIQNEDITSQNVGDNARHALLKLMINEPSGVRDLEEVVQLNPDFIQAELALAYNALKNNETSKARIMAEKWLVKYPDEPIGYNLMASIAMKEQQYDKAETLLTHSLSIDPENTFALLAQVGVARKQKNIMLSQKRVDNLIKLKPDNNQALIQYFGVYPDTQGLKKLQAAYDANKNDLDKALMVAEAMSSLKQYKQAEYLLTNFHNTPNLPKRYWQLLIFNLKKQNELSKVEPTLERWLIASPYHIEPTIILADLHSSTGDNDRALKVIERGLKYHKNNSTLKLVQMDIYLKAQMASSARQLYENLSQSNINDDLKQGILGRILLVEKNYKQALPKLKAFYTAFPTSDNALNIARSYIGNDEEPKAINVLEKHVEIDRNAIHIKSMLAGVYLKNDTKKAIVSYEELINRQPNNAIYHNNLAWLYLEQGNIEQALQHGKTAFTLTPNVAGVVDTYAKVLLRSGDQESALNYASKAIELPNGQHLDIQLNYAEILIANNQLNQAKQLLNSVIPKSEDQTKIKKKLLSQL